ncbi:hypothetical protein SCLCIDRAFT_18811 [Scleroderma citrinum Foug A]|uniref:Fungal-type protein kinase domain-containing protein n=1 Tax=Scleroderma citrinum Foug A TaxID=1036808 RepID=A0A0C3AAH9_9AGAM|nr:hypothetical protein SCLCIDRAFT_18811 [Scleroderma citrinum Foug A]
MDNLKKSFIEVAGKTAFLLYAQDIRHAAPSIQILGEDIVLTIFDWGGSLSTAPFSIHEDPEFFLRLLVSLSTSPLHKIGFDESVIWDEKLKKKRMLVTWTGGGKTENEIILEQVIFIADSLLGHGTTVWGGLMCVTWPTWE